MEDNDEKILTKKEFKLKAQSMKLEEKQRKLEEKVAIREEKERRKYSFGRKVRNFFLGIIFVVILLCVGAYFGRQFLLNKQSELFNEKMSKLYDKALVAIEENKYKEAIDLLNSIEQDYDKYDEVKKKITETEQAYLNEYLTESSNYLKDNKFDKAVAVLDSIESDYRKFAVVTDKYGEIYATKLAYEVAEMAKDTKNTNLDFIEFLVKYGSKDYEKFEDKKEELLKEYKNKFILEARELMTTDYNVAKVKIERASSLLKDDKDIAKLLEELKEAEPKTESLLTLKVSDTGKNRLKFENGTGTLLDMSGKKFTSYIAVISSYADGKTDSETLTYTLDGKYKTLSAILAKTNTNIIKKADLGTKKLNEPKVTIEVDGKVVYTSKDFDTNGTNMDISVNLTDAKEMKITFEGAVKDTYFLANPQLIVK